MVALEKWSALVGHYVAYGNSRLPRGAAATLPVAVLDLKKQTRQLGVSMRRITYEGAFLYACAEFEQVVRDLLREFAQNLHISKPQYNRLPHRLRKRLETKSAEILTRIGRDQYNYLSFDDVVSRLNSSVRQDLTATPILYDVVPEALSHTENNMKWTVLKDLLEGVGCEKLESLVCNYKFVRTSVGAHTKKGAMSAIPNKITDLMQKRNRIIHRSHAPFLPSDADVTECAKVFTAVAKAIHKILVARLANL